MSFSRKRGTALALMLALATASALADPTPAKKALIDKLIQLQQPMVEMLARNAVQQPLVPLMQAARGALQQVPADKREATAKAMDAEVKKFIEDNVVYVRDKAQKSLPSTATALFDERFNEDELRQAIAWFESPVSKKVGQTSGELQKALFDKVLAEAAPTLEGRFKTLQANLAKQMGLPAPGAPAPASSNKK